MSGTPTSEPARGDIEVVAEATWPRYTGQEHMLARRALIEVTGLRATDGTDDVRLPPTAELVLQLSCVPDLHRSRHAEQRLPMVGQVWRTSAGLLFLGTTPGRRQQEPATATASTSPDAWAAPSDRLQGRERAKGDEPVPATLACVLLEDPQLVRGIPVKCRRHGQAWIDSRRLLASARSAARDPLHVVPVVSIADMREVG